MTQPVGRPIKHIRPTRVVSQRYTHDELARIDERRGDEPRGVWIKGLVARVIAPDAEYKKQRFGEDVIRMAHEAADRNDGVDWALLEKACPDEMELDEFIDYLIGGDSCQNT